MIEVKNNKYIYNVILSKNPVNSINKSMLYEINSAIDSLDCSKSRVLVFSSSMKHFCAGADLKDRSSMSVDETVDFLDKINTLYNRISSIEIPTIASIDGACLGGGLELALACDFIISSNNSIFGFPETSIGIIPGAGGTQRMTRKVGPSISMKWIFMAEKYSAEDSFRDGVIDFLTIDHEKDVQVLIDRILHNSPIGLRMSKKSIKESFIDFGLKKEREAYLRTLHSQDRNEGLDSFKEKRTPDWKNK
ncbi:MAG: enoyl-CoA hydratase [Candidatus Marinimicrobia bacterium]|nr:enoyl-CoA hydratase [Candidatus Neomarinimicrobiota bacterium]